VNAGAAATSTLVADSETYPTIAVPKRPGFPSTPKSNTQSIPCRFVSLFY
jgi:hypothetical protein